MKTLIIAEKPKLAGNCVAGLLLLDETLQHKNGYYEGDNYVVTYCVGHLLGLKEIADYTGEKGWRSVALPFVPDTFEFKIKEETADQYEIVERLIQRSDIKEIYHLGDADREGEVIVRNVLRRAGNTHPVMRIWTDDQTETALADAISKVRPDKEYDNLFSEGLARTYLDWLYGINLTRYLTLRTNAKPPLRVGRVLIPIVKKIYDREMEIRNFVSIPYLQAEGIGAKNEIEYTLVVNNGEPRMPDDDVKRLTEKLNQNETVVESVEHKEKTISRPKLFDLGKAQARIAKLHKIGMTESMGCIQALYESGFLTYPRTDSEYLTDTEKEKVDMVLSALQSAMPEARLAQRYDKTVYDNSRVIGHSALRPTHKIPNEDDYKALVVTARQKAGGNKGITEETVEKCYRTILNRFLAVFTADEYRVAESVVVIRNGNNTFQIKGKTTVEKGFTVYDNTQKRDREIPDFVKGEKLQVKYQAVKKKTTPPKRLTVESLNNYLINPFKKEVEDDYKALAEGLSIGTQATRTGIIQNAIDSQYIACRDNVYYLLDRGEYLISTIDMLQINLYKDKTVELNRLLIDVHDGKINIDEAIGKCANELKEEIQKANQISGIKTCENVNEKTYKCPFCGGSIIHGKYGYFCKDNRDFSFSKFRGIEVTDAMMESFMEKKKILIRGMQSEKGSYDAYVLPDGWEHHDIYTNLKHALEFPKKKRRSGKK